MSIHRHVFDNAKTAAEHCAQHILSLLEDALAGGGAATLAVSGGSTPRPMFQAMARRTFPWDRVHLFWTDERAVPPADPRSNFRLVEESLLNPAHFPASNVHRVPAELMPDEAARRYLDDIRSFFGLGDGDMPQFDVVHHGLGEDAHTASLFPGEPLIEDRHEVVTAVFAEEQNQWRITLLPGALLAARNNVFLVSGADKAEAVRAVLEDEYDPLCYPAQVVTQHGLKISLFMDQGAASRLTA